METGGETEALAHPAVDGHLEVTEETAGARDGQSHGAQFTQQPVPSSHREAFLRGLYGQEEVGESLQAPWGKGDGHGDGVDDPTQDLFARRPACVTFE